jgi:hypothetical protein
LLFCHNPRASLESVALCGSWRSVISVSSVISVVVGLWTFLWLWPPYRVRSHVGTIRSRFGHIGLKGKPLPWRSFRPDTDVCCRK